MGRKLTRDKYYAILRSLKQNSSLAEFTELMERWDETRTDLNPEARWYGDAPEEGTARGWEGTGSKGEYVCLHCGETYRIPTILCYPQWKFCPNCGQKNMEV